VAAQRRNLSQAVADDLLTMLEDGRFQAGDKLPTERSLMEQFAVGRNTLREAVQSLVARGVLDVRPGTGTRVRSLAAETALSRAAISSLLRDEAVTHLYELRQVLEGEAAARAAVEATDEQIASMKEALDQYRSAIAAGATLFELDLSVHRAIATACSNPLFLTILDATHDLLARAREQTDKVPGAVQRALEEHERVVCAIEARDSNSARAEMHRHIQSAMWALETARSMSEVR
jgi:DNA-binding FadR family transcriptional regulator